MNINQLESYNLANAIKFHDTLNPLLWDKRENLHPEIHSQLLKIADDFRDFLGVNDLELKDITISGSNAAYSYTPHSDIDLHLIVDLSGVDHPEIYRELFDAKKAIYNGEHTITIKGIPVELYVQDAAQDHHSQGIYSIMNNDWIQIPRRVQADIDDMSVRSKYEDLSNRIDKVIKTEDLTKMNELAARIKKMRQEGLAEHGEFGPENLVFKMLRNQGHIEQLQTARHEAKSKELSLKERVGKPKTIYGYGRDFVDEVALTPGGVSDHTKMFVEKDEEPQNSQQEIIEDFIDFCSAQLGLAKEINLRIRRDPAWSVRNRTFGRYDEQTNELNVGVSGRHIMDILRTVAHELVHQRQNETQDMPPDAGADGSEYENEANAQAGVLMRRYGKLHPELFEPTELSEAVDGTESKKLVIFDIDDTLVHTQTKVHVVKDGNIIKSLNSHDFTHYKLQPGEEFDFGDFRDAREFFHNSKPIIPMIDQLKHDINTGNKVVMVTARADFNDRELFLDTFRKYGVDMSRVHVYRAGNMSNKMQTEEKKKIIIRSLLDKGNYTKAIMYDDATPNLHSFMELKKEYPETKFYAWHVSLEGDASEYQRADESLLEASGYIPTAAEANDPRYEMALTVDVRPGALGKAANSFLLNTDSQGHPQELRPDGLVNRMMMEYLEFKR